MVLQAHHERNQLFTIRPELVEGLIQRFHKASIIEAEVIDEDVCKDDHYM